MADNFCDQCGQRLTGADRFCSNCGAPVGAGIDGKSRFLERAAAQPKALGVPSSLLNSILAYSMMNAALDTDFLFVEDRKQRCHVIPLEFVYTLEGLKVLASVSARYWVKDINPSMSACFDTHPNDEVRETFFEKMEHIFAGMFIFPHFEPEHYGELDKDLRGNWVSVFDNEERRLVETVAPLTTSCEIMKARLRRLEASLKKYLASEEDSSTKEKIDEWLKNLNTVISEIPDDGFADHIYCKAFLYIECEHQDIVLLDDEPEATPVFRSSAFKIKSRSLRKRAPATTDFKRFALTAPPVRNIVRRLR